MGIDDPQPEAAESELVWLDFDEPERVIVHTPRGSVTLSTHDWRSANRMLVSDRIAVAATADGPELDPATIESLRRTGLFAAPTASASARWATPPTPSSARRPWVPHAIGHYRLLGRIGVGGFGDVFEAIDLERNEVVALKTLLSQSPLDHARLKAEVRLVADLAHPNILTPYEMLETDGRVVFTMRRVVGADFVSFVRGDDVDPSWSDVRHTRLAAALSQLHAAIGGLHSQGILHLDVKPSNVLVEPGGHLYLLDFGLSRHGAAVGSSGLGGTPEYMAPERVLGSPPTPADDWYAFGVLLFEALTGTLPFPSPGTLGVFASTFTDAPQASSVVRGVPASLDALCSALLARDPAMRAKADDVARALDLIHGTPTPALLTEPFVGRHEELARMHAHWRDLAGARALFLSGPAGIGKSALLEVFTRELAAHEPAPLVFVGRCHERESVAYKGLDVVIDGLRDWLSSQPAVEQSRYVSLDDHWVARMFPALGSLEVFARAAVETTLPAVEQRELAIAALKRVLGRVAQREGLVIVLDDVQWSSGETARLIAQLMAPPDALSALLVCAFRDTDHGRSDSMPPRPLVNDFVRDWQERALASSPAIEIRLGPLEPELAADLVTLVSGRESDDTAKQRDIVGRSEGNPFLVGWLARHSDSGASAEGVLETALARLSDGDGARARRYLEVVAIAGGPISQEVAAHAAELTSDEREVLAALRAHKLLRTHGPRRSDVVMTYHDRIRTLVVESLPRERRRTLHLAVAGAIEACPSERGPHPAELAWHYHEGGALTTAATYARRAGEAANAALAFDSAARHFGNALQWGPSDDDYRRPLLVARAIALADAGMGDEAARNYDEAAALHDGHERAALQRRAVEQRLLTGRLDEGIRGLRALARSEGLRFPRTTVGALWSVVMGLLRLRRKTRRIRGNPRQFDQGPTLPAIMRRLDLATIALRGMMTSDPIRAAYFGFLAAHLALRSGDRFQIALNLARVGSMLLTPFGPRFAQWGIDLVAFADEEAHALADSSLIGSVDIGRAMMAFWKGRWAEAFERSLRATNSRKGRPANGAYDCNLSRLMAIRSLEELGRWSDANAQNRDMHRDALDRGDLYAEVTALHNFGMYAVANGDAQTARTYAERADERWGRDGWHVQRVYGQRIQVYADLVEGAPDRAWQRVTSFWKPLKRNMHLSVETSRVDFLLLRARVALALAALGNAKTLRADALRCARSLATIARDDARAHAVTIEACVASSAGHADQAVLLFERAASVFGGLDMVAAAACVRLRRAQIVSGDHGAEVAAELARLAACGIAEPLRFADLYAPGPVRGVNAR